MAIALSSTVRVMGPISNGTLVELPIIVAEALRFFDGHGAARLLDSDLDLGAMVLERIRPGLTLLSIQDDEQATCVSEI